MPTYTIVGLDKTKTLYDRHGILPMAELWEGKLKDSTGYVWSDAVYKVVITDAARKRGCKLKSKTFKGETAWMDGERLWNDVQFWVQLDS